MPKKTRKRYSKRKKRGGGQCNMNQETMEKYNQISNNNCSGKEQDKKLYRYLAKFLHPDRNPNCDKEMLNVNKFKEMCLYNNTSNSAISLGKKAINEILFGTNNPKGGRKTKKRRKKKRRKTKK